MRAALRYLCMTILVGFFAIAVIGNLVQHGWPFAAIFALLVAAIAGAALL